MKVLVVISVLVALTAAASTGELELLTAFDFDALYKNDEQRKVAFDCLLDKAPCGELEKLKEAVVKVISNDCAECNPELKAKYEQTMKVFREKYEHVYSELMKKMAEKKQ